FFHALHRYIGRSGDRLTLARLYPTLEAFWDCHRRATDFGIHVDPADGLLAQGAEGYQLTWMDAKVDDWVVTPRRGEAVEINALWFNAPRRVQRWIKEVGDVDGADALDLERRALRAERAFNDRFWYPPGGYLYDVIDGPQGHDTACRPNQVLAISLDHPVLDRGHWTAVMTVVRDRLVTPVGLRSLAPGHPDYKSKYFGDLRSRDAAYHQGTVWAWLIGPFVDAWLKGYPDDREGARAFLEPLVEELNEKCIGSLNEVYD